MVLMLGMMLMMISMMPVMDDGDDDGDDLPFQEVISSVESTRRRWLFLLCRFPPRGGDKTRKLFFSRVFTPGGSYRREGAPRGATRHPGGCLAHPRGARQAPFWLPGGSSYPHLWCSPVILHKSDLRQFSLHLELI